MRAVLVVAALALACDTSPPCAPVTPHDGGCGETFTVDYDPATQTGCSFSSGTGTAQTCASLCGATATCEILTFTSVQCTTTTCGD